MFEPKQNNTIMASSHPHPADIYPKRVVWMQDEDTLKWVLVGLSADGEIQDPRYDEDVHAPILPDQPSGRIWTRDERTGKWINELASDLSPEELARAGAAVRELSSSLSSRDQDDDDDDGRVIGRGGLYHEQQQHQQQSHHQPQNHEHQQQRHVDDRPRKTRWLTKRGGAPEGGGGGSSLSSIHQKYAMRLSRESGTGTYKSDDAIAEDDDELDQQDVVEDGVLYHYVKPSDTFQFICLKYRVSADALRGANDFSGSTLKDAPRKLVIPKPSTPKKDNRSKKELDDGTDDGDLTDLMQRPKEEAEAEKKIIGKASSSYSSSSSSSSAGPIPAARPPAAGGPPPRKPAPGLGRPMAGTLPPRKAEKEDEQVVYHWVEPDDSLRWICLKYKISANDLRQANNFSGSNLKLAPKKLIIPKPSQTKSNKNVPKKVPTRLRKKAADGSGTSSISRGSISRGSISRGGGGRGDDNDSDLTSSFRSGAGAGAGAGAGGDDSVFSGTSQSTPIRNGFPKTSEAASSDVASAPPPMVHLPEGGLPPPPPLGINNNVNGSATNNGGAPYHSGGLYDFDSDSSSDTDVSQSNYDASLNGGVRYHDVRPTDTIEHLCMKYRVSAPALRRANIGLTGRNLQTGPKRLIVPPPSHPPTSGTGGGVMISGNFNPYAKKDTRDTFETETVTTHDDETNTLALSDGHSIMGGDQGDEDHHNEDQQVYHDVRPDDTLQSICLRYGVSAYELRRANGFRGLNLSSAPERLVIPKTERNIYMLVTSGAASSPTKSGIVAKDPETMTEDEKITALLARLPLARRTERPSLSREEARAYLKFNGWSLDQALRNAKVDLDWNKRRAQGEYNRFASGR